MSPPQTQGMGTGEPADVPRHVGLFGGTFDPVHNGHLLMARAAMESFAFDAVHFIPCARNPLKPNPPHAGDQDRVRMLRLAVRGEPGLRVSTFEVMKGGVSYAIDTVRHFRRRNPGAELFWLLGEDQKPSLHQWRRFPELASTVNFIFLSRWAGRAGGDVRLQFDISSTEIRDRVRLGLSIRYLVPDAVARHIARAGLYQP